MKELTGESLERFLDATAERVATPGGGSVTAAVAALAAALARMVAAYSVNKKSKKDQREAIETSMVRLHHVDHLLRASITADAVAYRRMTDAAASVTGEAVQGAASAHSERVGGGKSSDSDRDYQSAVLSAIAVPMETAALASQALREMDEMKQRAGRYLLSDLGIAAVLAAAAAQASWYTVQVNLPVVADPATRGRLAGEITTILEHCNEHRRSVEALVRERLEASPAASR